MLDQIGDETRFATIFTWSRFDFTPMDGATSRIDGNTDHGCVNRTTLPLLAAMLLNGTKTRHVYVTGQGVVVKELLDDRGIQTP